MELFDLKYLRLILIDFLLLIYQTLIASFACQKSWSPLISCSPLNRNDISKNHMCLNHSTWWPLLLWSFDKLAFYSFNLSLNDWNKNFIKHTIHLKLKVSNDIIKNVIHNISARMIDNQNMFASAVDSRTAILLLLLFWEFFAFKKKILTHLFVNDCK